MTSTSRILAAAATLIAALAVPPAAGQDAPEAKSGFVILPQSGFEAGGAGIVGDARYFGMYSGLDDSGLYAAFDGALVLRDESTGRWIRLTGSNLGLDSREFSFEHERQGDWRYSVDLSQTPKSNPLEITTGLTGIGSPVQSVAGTALRPVELETERKSARFSLSKLFGRNIDVKAEYRLEEKDGERQWGSQGFNFLTEPIDFVTHEISGSASYTGQRLQVTGGYLGSFYRNDNKVLDSDAGQSQIALPPYKQAHQVYLNGAYAITPKTRATLKASYGVALQDDAFFTQPAFPGNNRSDAGGQVISTLLRLGLNTRPLPKLTLNARLRYDERDDRTDRAQYIGPSASRTGFNIPYSRSTTTADLEARYRLPMGFGLAGGVKYEHWYRSKPVLRQASFRDNTDEASVRIELRRALREDLGGMLGYVHARRTGSGWHDGSAGQIDSINLGDRTRDKVRVALDWAPREDFTAGLRLEASFDTYDSRPLGPREGDTRFASLDLTYQIMKGWSVTAWGSLTDIRLDQATNGDGTDVNGAPVNDEDWRADQRQIGKAVGLMLRGDVMEGLKIGADFEFATDRSEQEVTGLGPSILPSLPDIRYRQAGMRLFADRRLSECSRIRINYGYWRLSADDWTWREWVYADGTTVRIPEREETHFLGIAYSYRW